MKKALPRKKAAVSAKPATVRKSKAASRKKRPSGIAQTISSAKKKKSPKKVSSKAVAPKKRQVVSKTSPKKECDVLPLTLSSQSQPSLSENNMISLKNHADKESFAYSEDSYGTQQRKKASRKKGRRPKIVRDRSFYDLEAEVDFELDGDEFSDDELISLDEFDSILHDTKGKTFNGREIEDDLEAIERRKIENCRKDLSHSPGPGKPNRRKKVQRRRQIDPTTCERDYTTEEVEFMTALDEYKRNSGRMFPTCSEILEVLIGLGYAKTPPVPEQDLPAVHDVQTQVVVSTAEPCETQVIMNITTEIQPTFTTIAFEYGQECSSFFLSDSFPVIEMSENHIRHQPQ